MAREKKRNAAKALPRFFLGALVAICIDNSIAWADIYAFTDESGIPHFSDVPDDSRYRLFMHTKDARVQANEQRGRSTTGAAMNAERFGLEVRQAASLYGLDEALLRAVILAESGFDPHAISRTGALGLMQLMPATARRYKVTNAFDPAQNISAGAQHLSNLLKEYDNNLQLALAAYNAGEENVRKYRGRIPPFSETLAYVPKVMDLYKRTTQNYK